MSIGTNIKKRRLELRMSQQELADAMGYRTRSTIAKIESGENDVSQKKLKKFAEILSTSVEALIFDHTPVIPDTSKSDVYNSSDRVKNVAIILAGGKSNNITHTIPDQFVSVQGKPLLVYCMEAYQRHPSIDDIYIVCLKGWETIVRDYAAQFGITKLRGLVPGGTSGVNSLENACSFLTDKCEDDTLVIIQEATRPLIRQETISSLLQACKEKQSATICHSMKDYVQFDVSGGKAAYVDRTAMIALQSPEAHRFFLIKEVFQNARMQNYPLTESCCTMLMYHLGYEINFLQSSINNIKIARNEDVAAFSAQIRE